MLEAFIDSETHFMCIFSGKRLVELCIRIISLEQWTFTESNNNADDTFFNMAYFYTICKNNASSTHTQQPYMPLTDVAHTSIFLTRAALQEIENKIIQEVHQGPSVDMFGGYMHCMAN